MFFCHVLPAAGLPHAGACAVGLSKGFLELERGGCARINLCKLPGHARFAYRRREDLYRSLVMGEIAGFDTTCFPSLLRCGVCTVYVA